MTAGVGIEFGTLAHIALAAVGLSYLVAASASAFAAVRYAGAAYLFHLAYRALRSSDTSAVPVTGGHPEPLARELRRAFLVNLLNPKVILFFVAFLPQFLHPERGAVWSQWSCSACCSSASASSPTCCMPCAPPPSPRPCGGAHGNATGSPGPAGMRKRASICCSVR